MEENRANMLHTVRRVTVDNVRPRRDTDGNIIDCHEGCMERFGDRFYLYGTSYGDTDGYQAGGNKCVCYSSADLMQWTYHGEIFPDAPKSFLYTPDVRYNPQRHNYILWYNWYPSYWRGRYGVAESDSPTGPFTIDNIDVAMRYPEPGDHGLLVDDDGTCYIIYNSIKKDHAISVEKLSRDFMDSTGENSGVFATNCEGASLFKRNGVYYALFDTCTMMGAEGSGVRVYRADKPLGPYTLTGNINRFADGMTIIPAQQAHIIRLPTADGDDAYMWIGTRWQSTPDRIKGHEFQYWGLLTFTPDGTIAPMEWQDIWTIDLLLPAVSAAPVPTAPTPSAASANKPIPAIRLGDQIRALREGKGLTIAGLAELLAGPSEAYLRDVELSRRFPTESLVGRIAAILDTPAPDLWAHDTRAREVRPADLVGLNARA
jgi:hypothetical protein